MKNKISRFLTKGLVSIFAVCILVFAFLGSFINKKSAQTIDQVGTLYMAGMNEQKTKHFETILEMYVSPVEVMAGYITKEDVEEEELVKRAKETHFESLSYYAKDGSFHMLFGEPIDSLNPEPFLESLEKGKKKVSAGVNVKGERVMLVGVPLSDPPAEREDCIALVATVPMESVSKNLFDEEETSLLYSFLIRKDGSFVVRQFDEFGGNFFERVRTACESREKSSEEYIEAMKTAINKGERYSTVYWMDGERRNMYCTSLPDSEWYLVTVMPYGSLNAAVDNLSRWWLTAAIGGCMLIMSVFLVVFLNYLKLNRHQIREVEEARQSAEEANRAKSEFLSNMSHDIRTPMNAIVGMTAIASAKLDYPQQVENCLKKIALSSRHLLGLINDILDMSKIESGKITLNMERVSLREIMDGIVNMVQPQIKEKGQSFDVRIYEISEEYVYTDGLRLNQVLLNLLSNAIKFTPREGSIWVSLWEEESPRGQGYVRIFLTVKDTGIGMSEEFQMKIFESFMREDSQRVHKTEGSGLGMAITKYIVDAMDGTIQVESKKDEGTEFRVTFDFETAQGQEGEMILPEWNMLVVDDDRQLCESTAESLKSIGIQAEWTLDGESAVELAVARHRSHRDFQVILLDWKLPGINGIETARQLRQKLPENIPILLISAYDWSEIEDEAREAGVSGFLPKPLFRSTLYYGLKPFMTGECAAAAEEWRVNFGGKKILLAEDNELNAEIAMEFLGDLGFEVFWAENGEICVEEFRNSPVGCYSAVLMDIRMPKLNGYEATEQIRAMEREDAKLPIIAMTADAFTSDIKRCMEHGMNAHIAKPIDVDEMTRVLQKYLTE